MENDFTLTGLTDRSGHNLTRVPGYSFRSYAERCGKLLKKGTPERNLPNGAIRVNEIPEIRKRKKPNPSTPSGIREIYKSIKLVKKTENLRCDNYHAEEIEMMRDLTNHGLRQINCGKYIAIAGSLLGAIGITPLAQNRDAKELLYIFGAGAIATGALLAQRGIRTIIDSFE